MNIKRVIRIIVIFLVIQILSGVMYTIWDYNNYRKSFVFPEKFTEGRNIYAYIFAWQMPFLVVSIFSNMLILGIIIALASILLFIWVAYFIEKKIFRVGRITP